MARSPRLEHPGAVYRVTSRGDGRSKILMVAETPDANLTIDILW